MKKFLVIVIIICLNSCSKKIIETNENCSNQFINKHELELKVDEDYFYVEDINMHDTINFDYSGTDSFFRAGGPYMIKKINSNIESAYKQGVYINSSYYNDFKDSNLSHELIYYDPFSISEKLMSLKNQKEFYKINNSSRYELLHKPAVFRYTKHLVKISYIFIGYGCIYIPNFSKKKVIYKRIRVPVNVIVKIDEI